jgi:DNA oxidative demethylase
VNRLEMIPGVLALLGYLGRAEQEALRDEILVLLREAPLFTPRMPRTGKPFSVRMTNFGELGWVSDECGYRYQATHPATGGPWPAMPRRLLEAWRDLAPDVLPPQACLVNFYGAGARMGLHQDRDEQDFSVPVVSLSLGDSCLFRIGGAARRGSTRSLRLDSGDAIAFGGPARLAFHGVDRVYPDTSTLLEGGGRINLTLRRVAVQAASGG